MHDAPAMTVLFVEDDEMILGLLRRLSASMDCTSLFASTAEAALTLCAAGRVDVVVTDFSMPGSSGLTLLSTVTARWPQTVRVLMTGHPRTYFDEAELDRAVDALVLKPWNGVELRGVIATMIARARERVAA